MINRTDSYAFDTAPRLSNDKTYVIPAGELSLLAILNSSALTWFIHAATGVPFGGFLNTHKQFMETVPIPAAPPADREALEALVDRILKARQENPAADVSAQEREIDDRVYRLYGLSKDGIKVVEDARR